MKVTYRAGDVEVTKATKKADANFALIGRFKDEPHRVISLHSRRELANVADVYNGYYSDIRVAERVS